DRTRVWRSVAVLGATATIAGAVVFAMRPTNDPCEKSDERLIGVWDDERRQAVDRAFAAPALSYERASLAGPAQLVDAYANDWAVLREDTCRATHDRGEQSEAVLDLKMQCLARRRDELGSLVDLLSEADDVIVPRAVGAAAALTPIAGCD